MLLAATLAFAELYQEKSMAFLSAQMPPDVFLTLLILVSYTPNQVIGFFVKMNKQPSPSMK